MPPEPASVAPPRAGRGAAAASLGALVPALAGAGCVTLFFSEYFFFNEGPALGVHGAGSGAAALAEIASLALFYTGFAAILAAALSAFSVTRWEGLVLSGCLFGWGVEGTVIPVVYEAVPLSLLWTSVGWHMPVDVVLGLIVVPWMLRRGWVTACTGSALLGVGWALWCTWTWADGPRLSPEAFTDYALLTSTALIAGAALLLPVLPALWAMPRPVAVAVAIVAAGFGLMTGLVHPLGLLLLATLVLVTLAALRRLARRTPGTRLPPPSGRAPRALALILTPLAAIPTYALLWETGGQAVTQDTILLLLFAATCVFFLSLWRAFTRG